MEMKMTDCRTAARRTEPVKRRSSMKRILSVLLCAALYLSLDALRANETLCIAGSIAGFALGAAAVAAINRFVRHDRPFDYEIISVDRPSGAEPPDKTESGD